MDFYGLPWISADFYGFMRISIDFRGFLFMSVDNRGLPWMYVDVRGLVIKTNAFKIILFYTLKTRLRRSNFDFDYW